MGYVGHGPPNRAPQNVLIRATSRLRSTLALSRLMLASMRVTNSPEMAQQVLEQLERTPLQIDLVALRIVLGRIPVCAWHHSVEIH